MNSEQTVLLAANKLPYLYTIISYFLMLRTLKSFICRSILHGKRPLDKVGLNIRLSLT